MEWLYDLSNLEILCSILGGLILGGTLFFNRKKRDYEVLVKSISMFIVVVFFFPPIILHMIT